MEAWDSTGAVYSGSYSLADDVAGAQSDYETRHGEHSRRAGSRRAPMVPALEVSITPLGRFSRRANGNLRQSPLRSPVSADCRHDLGLRDSG